VRDSASTPIEGVLLTGTNTNPDTLTTSFDGSYQFNANEHSEVTIVPSKTGYNFDPLNFYNADITQDYENYNFTAVEWTPDPPTGGTPQGTNVPLTTSHITWSAPAGGCPVTKYIVTMSVDSIAVEGFDGVEVLAPDTTITIPADTLHYSTTYEVSVIANYTAPVRGNSIPLEWNFSTEDLPPVANFSSNLTDGYAPLSVNFIDQSTPGSGMIFEWKWFFGDGDSSFVQNPTHIYQNPGTYTVSLTVTDEHDSTDTEVKIDYISVLLQPVADFTADLFSGYVPLEVSFTDQSLGNIITWAWDFNGDEIVDSYLQNPVYTYFQEGIYPVSLTINDSISEDTEVKQDYIEVSNLIVTEILQNPGVVLDNYGEWFEILNPCDFSIDLNGIIIKDNDWDSLLIDTTAVIQAGRYFVLGKNADYATNGGVNLDYEYSDITLSNSSDELIFVSPSGTTIDSVAWDNGVTFPDPDSASMALLDQGLDNSIGTNWTTSIIPFGDGDFGTPGYPNFVGQISVSTDSISFPDLMIGMITNRNIEISNT
jgi:PKD repeat protein